MIIVRPNGDDLLGRYLLKLQSAVLADVYLHPGDTFVDCLFADVLQFLQKRLIKVLT